jgi:hypothetical protein
MQDPTQDKPGNLRSNSSDTNRRVAELTPPHGYRLLDVLSTHLPDYDVFVSRQLHDSDWDSFLLECPGGHPEQTSLWAEVKRAYGWQPLRIVVTRNAKILGGVQLLTGGFRRPGRIGYVNRGPSVRSHDPELIGLVLQQLDRAAKSEKLAYVAIGLPYNGFIYEEGLRRIGFRLKPRFLPPLRFMTATAILDLSPDLDSLMATMRRQIRQNVRRAERSGLTVREGRAADVETFRRLMWALCERRGTCPTPPQKDFFERLWKVFHPAGFLRLFVAEARGQAVCALLTFPFGDTVYAWKMGWAGNYAECSPNKMLFWEAIRWSKNNGYRWFDFVSIDRAFALTLQRGDPVDWASVEGPDNFKFHFGAKPVLLPEPYYRFYHPLLRLWAWAGGARLLESPATGQYIARLSTKLASRLEAPDGN